MEIIVTDHAVLRYRERVADVTPGDAIAAMCLPVVVAAIRFGARYVRLGTGQRLVLHGNRVVTVLPREHRESRMSTAMDQIREESRYG